ncbi:DUF2116 family Zn-ribbon domain-containing protein [Chryseolinea sp. Jin1]|uniref:DUF2116 family Zn-ribbon domain-containing protein n=1 Tax=Chryseolinea lacunae TaxID=2801331 RepID=A0ABS1L0A6_9BACT|nr:DUF2116 family Zn-ribbon domain-containing protein [Chryseolinea lacunae]MBL0745143.1 DUF2116 family Zn-ribbon domain-containing protein [Chryseolinea lacunae]
MPDQNTRYCLECGTEVRGRLDKKFCDDQCRTQYNNRLNRKEAIYMRTIILVLRRNRRILKSLNPMGKAKVSSEKMKLKGFDFSYFTNISKTRNGRCYFFCFDQGYLPVEKGYCRLVTKNKNTGL